MHKRKTQRAAARRPRNQDRPSTTLDAFLGNPLALLSLLVALYAIVQAWSYGGSQVCVDYYQFWAVGQALHEVGGGDIYSEGERRRIGRAMWDRAQAQVGADPQAQTESKRYQAARYRQVLETYSTPWLYTCFALLSTRNYELDQGIFQSFSLICYVFGVAVICNVLGCSPAFNALAIAAFLYWFGPTVSDTDVGNINRLELALLALFLWVQRWKLPASWQFFLGGLLFGCGVMFKPNLGFVALMLLCGWLISRQRRKLALALAGMAAGSFASVAVSAAYFGSVRPWMNWARELPRLMTELDLPLSQGNYALARLMQEGMGFKLSLALPLVFIGSAVLVLLYCRIKQKGLQHANLPEQDLKENTLRWDVLLIGLGGTVSLLSSQLAWLHYFLLAVPLILYLMRPGRNEGSALAAGSWALRGLVLVAGLMIALEPFKAAFNLTAVEAKAAIVSGGTILLFTLALLHLISGPAQPGMEQRERG